MASVEGMKELSLKLSKLQRNAGGKILRSAAMSATLPVLRAAQANVPKGTEAHKTYKGRLVGPGFASRNVRRRSRLSKDKTRVFVSIGVSKEAFYTALFLELGTRYIQKKPWLRPALRDNQKEVVKRFSAIMKKKIEQTARSTQGKGK